jgi:putative phage-type endonuclease
MERKQWLEWRRGGIGSSDAAAILGVSPYKTAYELYMEKVYGKEDEEDNAAMEYGRKMEPIIREWIEDTDCILLEPRNIEHPSVSFMRCSVDAISLDGRVVYEIKTANEVDHNFAKQKIVPPKYVPQVKHQILVTSCQSMHYVSFHQGDFRNFRCKYTGEELSCHWNTIHNFWFQNVEARVPPPKTEADFEDFSDNPEWVDLFLTWQEAQFGRKSFEKHEEEIKKKIIKFTAGKNARGAGFKLTRTQVEGSIDYKVALNGYQQKLAQMYPALVFPDFNPEEFRRPSFLKFTPSIKSM